MPLVTPHQSHCGHKTTVARSWAVPAGEPPPPQRAQGHFHTLPRWQRFSGQVQESRWWRLMMPPTEGPVASWFRPGVPRSLQCPWPPLPGPLRIGQLLDHRKPVDGEAFRGPVLCVAPLATPVRVQGRNCRPGAAPATAARHVEPSARHRGDAPVLPAKFLRGRGVCGVSPGSVGRRRCPSGRHDGMVPSYAGWLHLPGAGRRRVPLSGPRELGAHPHGRFAPCRSRARPWNGKTGAKGDHAGRASGGDGGFRSPRGPARCKPPSPAHRS